MNGESHNMTAQIKYILAVDPGDTTGWATLTYEGGHLILWDQVAASGFVDKFMELIKEYGHPVVIVYEDFIVFKRAAAKQAGSRMFASQVIGALKTLSKMTGIPLESQSPDKKDLGAKGSGRKAPSRHSESHKYDAFNHGFYYLCKIKKAKTQLEIFGHGGSK